MTTPPSVLHVISARGIGGAERMLAQLVAARRSKPFRQAVVNLMQDPTLATAVRGAGVDYRELGLGAAWHAPAVLILLARLIRELSPSAIQTWMYSADLMTLYALEWSGRRQSTRLYWGIRCSSLDFSQYNRSLRWTVGRCLRLSVRPDGIIANSFAGLAAHHDLGYAPRRAVVIPNGIDILRFRPDVVARQRIRATLGISSGERVAIHAARVDPMKDHCSVIKTASLLPDIKFLLAGRGTLDLPRAPNVLALGSRDDMPDLYAASDVLLSSSAFGEGFPNVVGEAMACGLPVVATDVGDSVRIVGDTGRIVSPRDPAQMAQALQFLLDEPADTRSRRSLAARARIERNFSLERAVAAFDALHLRNVWPAAAVKPMDSAEAGA